MKKTLIDVAVIPKSSRSKITIDESEKIKIYLNSPPVNGKANSELIKLVSKALGLNKSSIEIVKGSNSRKKTLKITGLERDEVLIKIRKVL